ncbi:MAG: TVP38/TMEM64 family protein [Mogibacterium sp.]|nr:TVP38/TMEM64 family protein [Mogibacterium sp.]
MNDSRDKGDFSRHKKILAVIKFALLLFVIIGIPLFLYLKFGADIFSKEAANQVITYLKANREISFLLIILIQAVQVIICVLPGQPIQFASSYMFGIWIGFILSLCGAVIGAAISFFLAKVLGRDILYILFDETKVEDYKRKLNSGRGLLIVLLIYLVPGVPKDLVAYVAGISEMKFRPFILISTAARSPGMLGSLLLGHFYGAGNYRAIAVLLIAVSIILIICFIKRKMLIDLLDKIEENN